MWIHMWIYVVWIGTLDRMSSGEGTSPERACWVNDTGCAEGPVSVAGGTLRPVYGQQVSLTWLPQRSARPRGVRGISM